MLDQVVLDTSVLDGSPLFSQIAENARIATGAPVVELTTFSRADRLVRPQAIAGCEGLFEKPVGKASRPAVNVNSFLEAVYLEGQAVTAPFEMVEQDSFSVPVRAAARSLRLTHATVYPMKAKRRVLGAVAFYSSALPSDESLAAYGAFAHQASMTIEQAALFRSLQDELGDLTEARRLVTASNEAVRRDIAERLHGPVQTQLVVADFTLRRASALIDTAPDEAQQAICEARALLDLVREKEIRDVSHILHPCVIGLGLAPAMRSLVDRFRALMDVTLEMHPDLDGVGHIAAADIDDSTRLAAYRVVEEGLANAHKHGQANEVQVSIDVTPDERLVVKVVDDGLGFGEDLEPGLGLRLIALKVEEVRGSWAVGRSDTGGAALTAVLPFKGGSLAGIDVMLQHSGR